MNSNIRGAGKPRFSLLARLTLYALLPALFFLVGFFALAPALRRSTVTQDLKVQAPVPLSTPRAQAAAHRADPPVQVTERRVAGPEASPKAEQSAEGGMKLEIHQPVAKQDQAAPVSDCESAPSDGSETDTPTAPPAEKTKSGLYRVEVGGFSDEESATQAASALADKGYAPVTNKVITESGTHYRLQVGAFRSRDNATRVADDVRSAGYSAQVAGGE